MLSVELLDNCLRVKKLYKLVSPESYYSLVNVYETFHPQLPSLLFSSLIKIRNDTEGQFSKNRSRLPLHEVSGRTTNDYL